MGPEVGDLGGRPLDLLPDTEEEFALGLYFSLNFFGLLCCPLNPAILLLARSLSSEESRLSPEGGLPFTPFPLFTPRPFIFGAGILTSEKVPGKIIEKHLLTACVEHSCEQTITLSPIKLFLLVGFAVCGLRGSSKL